MIPTLVTDRLVLRAPTHDDFDALSEIYTSDRARYMGGPFSPVDAWRFWSAAVSGWTLQGFGYWTITERRAEHPSDHRTDAIIGAIGLSKPVDFPEREFGWEIRAAHEGHGYAYEAALAVRRFAFEDLGWETLVSYIHPENARSIALAERLGAVLDHAAARPEPEDLVFRHPKTAVQQGGAAA